MTGRSYPAANAGFFLKVGAGLSLLNAELIGASSTVKCDMASGFGMILGAGYDIPV